MRMRGRKDSRVPQLMTSHVTTSCAPRAQVDSSPIIVHVHVHVLQAYVSAFVSKIQPC